MGDKGGWYTKEDILRDIAEATGSANVHDIDEQFLVRGDRPPPRRIERDFDDEMHLRYGDYLSTSPTPENSGPDLDAIRLALRQYQEHEESKYARQRETAVASQFVISKLNPNVKEFVPKNLIQYKKKSNGQTPPVVDEVTKEDLSDTSEEMKKAKLKETIKKNAKTDSLKGRRERNVAIAELMKLSSEPARKHDEQNPATPSPISHSEESHLPEKEQQKLTLFPPEYFEGPICSTDGTLEEDEHLKLRVADENNDSAKSSSGLGEVTAAMSNLTINSPRKTTRNPIKPDPQVQESIQKVNNWFSRPEKPEAKVLMPQMGPIEYRKKVSSVTAIPITTASKVPSDNIPVFVPSQYARDLAKQYEERAKSKTTEQLDWQVKLEMDLKERDEAIRQQKEKTESDQNTSSRSSSKSSRRHRMS